MNTNTEFRRWMECADEETVREMKEMTEEETLAFFTTPLSFGTAGLRAKMKPGIGGMNRYTVAQATEGLSAYLLTLEGAAERGVLVGYDSRNHSAEFAQITATVLAENQIKVYLYDELRPVPMVSFGVRELHCIAGVNITASHNPKEYNGYKVFGEDGAQIGEEEATAISDEIGKAPLFPQKTYPSLPEAIACGSVRMVGEALDEAYMEKVLAGQVDPTILRETGDRLKVVYTPFHGAGRRLVPEVLRRAGLQSLYPVEAQMIADGDFPTVVSPNPENPEGFAMATKLAQEIGSDLIVGTDPDCDRVGTMARGKDGTFRTITGNRMGALLLDYILGAYTRTGRMPPSPYAVKTIVTTELARAICRKYGVKLYDVLTGFKYIGEVMTACEKETPGIDRFILGYEESYGYLKSNYARDKDGVIATLLICEMAAYYRQKGMTLLDAEEEMLERYGYYTEHTANVYMEGVDGKEKMAALLRKLRRDPPQTLGGKKVTVWRDYLAETVTDAEGNLTPTGLPRSDVLGYDLEGGSRFIVRPSGTEPKIKFYLLVTAPTEAEAEALKTALRRECFFGGAS